MNDRELCPVCRHVTSPIGTRLGVLDKRVFHFRRCGNCNFSYVQNHRSDFHEIYNEDYYRGRGGDPMVDYVYEADNASRSVRSYEYEGICKIYGSLCPGGGKWLDFGCGNGGLIKYGCERSFDILGYDEGWAARLGRSRKIPILNSQELENYVGHFDFITAIEVFEHTANPLTEFRRIRSLLKKGGKLFLTTGNAEPWKKDLLKWSYTTVPDVHISFFEPKTVATCMRESGFSPQRHGFLDGFTDIIKYKMLKNLGINNRNITIDMLPWKLISRFVDLKYKVTNHPHGIAVD